MEPEVIRMYSSSPPPLEDGAEEEDDEFGDFGGFSSIPNSISFTEFDTPATLNQTQALNATSPPELNNVGAAAFLTPSIGAPGPQEDLSKTNGVLPGACHGGSHSERTVCDAKKVLSGSVDFPWSGQAGSQPMDCNREGVKVLMNGFAPFEAQGSPRLHDVVHPCKTEASTEDSGTIPPGSQEDNFADFAAFCNTGGHRIQTEDSESPHGGGGLAEQFEIIQEVTLEDLVRDTNRTELDTPGLVSISVLVKAPDGLSNGNGAPCTDTDSIQQDTAFAHEHEPVCTKETPALNGFGSDSSVDTAGSGENHDLSPPERPSAESGGVQSDGKGSGNETETETETSLGRPLSTDALEEYGDMSTTGSATSPPLQEDTATPADHSQLAEDDEDFGDFGDAGCPGFADFDQQELDVQLEQSVPNTPFAPAPEPMVNEGGSDDDFGDFNAPKFQTAGMAEGDCDGDSDGEQFADFPSSDSFGNFNSVVTGAESGPDAGWITFDKPEFCQGEGDSWAAFGEEQGVGDSLSQEEWHQTTTPAPAPVSDTTSRMESHSVALSSRLEKLFQHSFPDTPVHRVGEEVLPLQTLLEPAEEGKRSSPRGQGPEERRALGLGLWRQLQDIHEALGLRHQWGGSHSNKTLLCSLGIDTRNILFTGQKKQPVIVPMYAASLGMLEPTKEPVKPVSAAEMIASIAQVPPVGPEKSPCPPDTAQQEALPPVQFDWSSSGLTNPLDGVDPELYELTTAKLDPASSGSRVADAFARLMSTMEKTSTSTRKPKKEEHLSQEAAKVIAALPDLSFMQAKVLMFPTTLTPLGCSSTTPN